MQSTQISGDERQLSHGGAPCLAVAWLVEERVVLSVINPDVRILHRHRVSPESVHELDSEWVSKQFSKHQTNLSLVIWYRRGSKTHVWV